MGKEQAAVGTEEMERRGGQKLLGDFFSFLFSYFWWFSGPHTC
jgi:hypothetical protein